jgi:hypothetical protein
MGHPASSWSPTFQNVTSQENFQAERPPAHRAGEAELSNEAVLTIGGNAFLRERDHLGG